MSLEGWTHRLVGDPGDRWAFAAGLLTEPSKGPAGVRTGQRDEPAADFAVLTSAAKIVDAVEAVMKADGQSLDLAAGRVAARRLRVEVERAAWASGQLTVGLPDGVRLRSGRRLPARPRPEQLQEALEMADLDDLQLLVRRRRRAAENGANAADGRPWWTVTYDAERGNFHAAGPGKQELVGWAPLPAAAEDLLRGCQPAAGAPIRMRWAGAPRVPRKGDDPWQRPSLEWDGLQQMLADRSSPELTALTAAVSELRERMPLGHVEEYLAAAAARLQHTVPQPPDPDHELESDDAAADATAAGWFWVPPATIVVTDTATIWGEFGTHRPEQPALISRALVGDEDIHATLVTVLSEYDSPVSLRRFPGPAGPIHVLDDNGCHRIHLWRMLDLPYLPARVTIPALPRQLTASSSWPYDEDDALPLWEGLIRRGLVDADLDPTRRLLRPVRVPALWFFAPPTTACAVNTAYNRVYPGSLESLGIPEAVAGHPDRWRAWLTA